MATKDISVLVAATRNYRLIIEGMLDALDRMDEGKFEAGDCIMCGLSKSRGQAYYGLHRLWVRVETVPHLMAQSARYGVVVCVPLAGGEWVNTTDPIKSGTAICKRDEIRAKTKWANFEQQIADVIALVSAWPKEVEAEESRYTVCAISQRGTSCTMDFRVPASRVRELKEVCVARGLGYRKL